MKYLPWVVAVIALVIAWRSERSPRSRIDTLTVRVAQVDTIRIRDSVRVVRTVRALDTIRHTVLERLTDTVAVKEYIYKTDTLRTACLACITSAARLSAVNDSLQRAWRTLWDQRKRDRKCGASAGIGLFARDRTVVIGPNISLSCRVWP